MKLANFTHGRDNNFNLIRICAALVVLVNHSFDLTRGTDLHYQSLQKIVLTIMSSETAVNVFFITSGFLVTGSLLTRKNLIEFAWARVLRIYPALLVLVLLTVFGLGVFFTTTSLSTYFTDDKTYSYLLRNSTLFGGVAFGLPGVFENNPFKGAVNGSLWTMPKEIKMYAILAIIWGLASLRSVPASGIRVFKFIVVSSAVAAGLTYIFGHFYFPSEGEFTRLFFMFFTGAAFYVLKEHIPLSRSFFWLSIFALTLAAIDKPTFFVAYNMTLAYILFFVAYVPSGRIRAYNRTGDYSYGVYIYAFPVQQSIAALVPDISGWSMIMVSAVVTLSLAALSWHLLEQHALGLKDLFVVHTRRFINVG